jgi:hypothetical protein
MRIREKCKLDYEQYYEDAQVLYKRIKEKSNAQTKAVNGIIKCISDGDTNALPRLFEALRESSSEGLDALDRLDALTAGFDGREYMANGDYAGQLLECCREMGIDVQGAFPVYEMFPCRVTINAETQDVMVDRKRLQCLRPSRLAGNIKTTLEKLAKAPFNAQLFCKELAAAYDLAIIKASGKKRCSVNAPIYAIELYDILTPMRRHKRDYTRHNFAYDLARLHSADDCLTLDDGRTLRFDTARDTRKSIRILDRHGAEQYITTIRFTM